ncbi:hypothetical protein CROQUDRAFT_97459 [Cronartium quercuum f. sp. fusiforme G11]|uniref:Uncharacterized protein n=1 Tax=Cronartium quercuum f. sp. fusiforme G11 TaxID=708437 RepID=A0A9P6NF06_9BASI|nr:hypothetical protein CROQUDRAFT_97459 [Cronartium quercuum f. sp. fusiforme G11]
MPKSAMVTKKRMSLSIPELINGLHAHPEVSFVKALPPFSARCPPQRKSSRVELIFSVAFPLKAPNHHSSFLKSKISVRPMTKTSSHSANKAIHKSSPYWTIPTSLLTPSEYQTKPSVQPALFSSKVSVPHSAKCKPVPMPYTNTPTSQFGSVMPKPTSHKQTSVPSATCAKAFQLSARVSAHKQLLNSLCCDMLSNVIAPIASHVAQQALRNKVRHSLAEQIQTTQHFVDHLSKFEGRK